MREDAKPPDRLAFRLLDVCRGLAALWVFAFHYEWSDSVRANWPRAVSVFSAGHLGVPMFFVISGYCVAASAAAAARTGESPRSFLWRRVKRIYPAFWCSVLVTVMIPFANEALSALKTGRYQRPAPAFASFGLEDWGRHLSLAQVFVRNPDGPDQHRALVHFNGNLPTKFNRLNAVYWSLAIELQFYMVVAAALAVRGAPWSVIAVTTVVALPLMFSSRVLESGLFVPLWPMFALGIGLYVVSLRGWAPRQLLERPTWFPAALAVVVIAACSGVVSTMAVGYLRFAWWFACALWLMRDVDWIFESAQSSPRAIARWPSHLFLTLGTMSYSVYLLHAKLLYPVKQVARQIFPSDSIAFDLSVIVLTLLLCYLFYLACERPFISRRPSRRRRAVVPRDRLVVRPAMRALDRTVMTEPA